MVKPVIEIEGLSKRYFIHHRQTAPYGSLRDDLVALAKRPFSRAKSDRSEELWALKDINCSVERGDSLAIIGRNGSGKSTLLKILSRIVDPTNGKAVLRGEVASLLEVGTGFHPELTGRENIYLNGSILGLSRRAIAARFDEIVAFAETERFLDTPVKFYSSGMYVRLAFAVAAHLDPDILIVDEVLAVGDAAFQQKCLARMGETAREGRTVLFVSHNLNAVRTLCNRAMLLEEGRLIFNGGVDGAVENYSKIIDAHTSGTPLANRARSSGLSLEAVLKGVELRQEKRSASDARLDSSQALKIILHIEARQNIDRDVAVHIAVMSSGQMILRFESEHNGACFKLRQGSNSVMCTIQPSFLAGGHYTLDCSLLYPGSEHLGHIDVVNAATAFVVDDLLLKDRSAITQREAVYWIPHKWEAIN